MTAHTTRISSDDGGWWAHCTCGWVGETYRDTSSEDAQDECYSAAAADADDHEAGGDDAA